MTSLDFLTGRFGRNDSRLRRTHRRGPVVRAALVLFFLLVAMLNAIVVTLNRNADRTNRQQISTELASGTRVAASSFSSVRADLRAQASQLATSLDLQRAIVANDRNAIARIANAHHAVIRARGATFGHPAPEPRLTSTATIAQGSAVIARVTLTLPLDKRLLDLIRATAPLPTNAALIFARHGRVIVGGPVGASATIKDGRLAFGSTTFVAQASRLGADDTAVLAVEPMAAVRARALPYRRKVILLALLTLVLAAGLATRLGRPLARKLGELTHQAETDPLTGLANRRALDERLVDELDRSTRHGTHLSLVLLDIDDFKQVNDRLGHQGGDEVLRAVSAVLAGSVRELDLAGRFGGEEFALVLPGTPLEGARLVADQIRQRIASAAISGPGGEAIAVTASFGVAQYPTYKSAKALIASADVALYEAKRAGKNRVATQKTERDETLGTPLHSIV